MKMTSEIREIINKSKVHLATSSKEGKPNVVPIGFVEAISDHQLLVADILFGKTRKNLEENSQVPSQLKRYRNLKRISSKAQQRSLLAERYSTWHSK